MVLATGLRAKGSRRAMDHASGQLESILARMKAGQIAPEKAAREAASLERFFVVLPQLQANFAFTKAYVADAGGSAAGLGGPRCFVDTAVFDRPVSPWIRAEPPTMFKDGRLGLSGEFAAIRELTPPGHSTAVVPGVRDARQIVDAIAPSGLIRAFIRSAR